jgi:NADH dehydrogenase FAD-containing subunit
MDISKGAVPDNRHRALTHNSWFLSNVLERVFGHVITNSEGHDISVREIGERHVLEDFQMKFIPTAQDYLQEMEIKHWMNNGVSDVPPSHRKIEQTKKVTRIDFD